jgi:photosystem II stability/assembly factor-like uncharacterized protein
MRKFKEFHCPIEFALNISILFFLTFMLAAPSMYGGSQIGRDVPPNPGQIRSLAIDPKTPQTIYAGAISNCGVFKSTDGGRSWVAINAGLINKNVVALAIDPSAPQTIYAGTTYMGGINGGVFKSTDGGSKWIPINTGMPDIPTIGALAIDPSTPQTVYAATGRNGVVKSTNGGKKWFAADKGLPNKDVQVTTTTPSKMTPAEAGLKFRSDLEDSAKKAASALAIDPSAPQTVYVGTGSGVFKSTDGGLLWVAVNTGLTNTYIMALAIDPLAPQTVYAGTHGGGVFKSTDGGHQWIAVNTGLPKHGAFETTDGGLTFTEVTTGTLSADVGALAISPSGPKTVYAAADDGIFKSPDGGQNWIAINKGVPSTFNDVVRALVIDPSAPNTVYAGTGDGRILKITDSGSK